MYQVNDLIIYSTHGLCRIHDITDKTYGDSTKSYYVLQPCNDPRLSINIPVNSEKTKFIEMVDKQQALHIIELFNTAKEVTIEKNFQQTNTFNEIMNEGNRNEIVNIIYTLMIKKDALAKENKKCPIHEVKLLNYMQNLLFTELAASLNTTKENINDEVEVRIFH